MRFSPFCHHGYEFHVERCHTILKWSRLNHREIVLSEDAQNSLLQFP